jgi:hypothetical protein
LSDTRSLSTIPSTVANQMAGQATMVEQQRAIAEVQGAIVVAQQCPRDTDAAIEAMKESCGEPMLAERAFFRFPKGRVKNEETGKWEENFLIGPSVHLARELARLWGNLQYGIKELSRDDYAGESQMLAYAWDVQTNTRVETVFIVKHLRDKTVWVDKKKEKVQEKLTDLRDIYENNANAGARRVRECVFAILPPWFVEQAKEKCAETNTNGGGKPLPLRVSEAVERFAALGVRKEQLERKLGRKMGKWVGQDLAVLIVVYRSLVQSETTVEAEFPPEQVESDELAHTTVMTPPEVHTPTPTPATPRPEADPAERHEQQATDETHDVNPPNEPGEPDGQEWPDVVQPGTANKDTK